ncbi:MAG: hypothetical protein ABI652_03185 [Acidobacteriota bacterium]
MSNWTRRHPRVSQVMAAAVVIADAGIGAARLQPATIDGWNGYVMAIEAARAQQTPDAARFLALDFTNSPVAAPAADRAAVLAGDVVTRHVNDRDAGLPDVPSATVSHWRGAVFIPGTSLDRLIHGLRTAPPPPGRGDVVRSAILENGPEAMVVAIRVRRSKIVTVVYDTEHRVTFSRSSARRAESASTATRIVEVVNAGTAAETPRPPGDDRGYLWRLNAYWRYEEVRGGVIAECDSISLSRHVPAPVRYLAGSIIEGAAREAMDQTLVTLRDRFAQ